jgi:hypothetical protein
LRCGGKGPCGFHWKKLAPLVPGGLFHDRRSCSKSVAGILDSWCATSVQATTPSWSPFRCRCLIFCRTMPFARCPYQARQARAYISAASSWVILM